MKRIANTNAEPSHSPHSLYSRTLETRAQTPRSTTVYHESQWETPLARQGGPCLAPVQSSPAQPGLTNKLQTELVLQGKISLPIRDFFA